MREKRYKEGRDRGSKVKEKWVRKKKERENTGKMVRKKRDKI